MDEVTLNFELPQGRSVRITATPSMAHPEQCTFTVSEPVYPGHSAFFGERERPGRGVGRAREVERGKVHRVQVRERVGGFGRDAQFDRQALRGANERLRAVCGSWNEQQETRLHKWTDAEERAGYFDEGA